MEEELVIDEQTLEEDLDNEHAPMIIQGALDSLNGVESYAVCYLGGALVASGQLPGHAVHGNETVWSTIKTGFGKSIQYIRNIFTGVWGYFFGKDAETEDVNLNDEVKAETAELEKVDNKVEMTSGIKTAIVDAGDKAKAMGHAIVAKAKNGIDKAKILADEMQLHERLDAAIVKLGDIMESTQAIARKQGLGVTLAIQMRAQLWALYFTKFRGVITADIKSAAAKTNELIGKIEAQIKSGSESVTDDIKQRLASLKETMKSYTIIQNMKTNFRSLIKGMVGKLTAKSFAKKPV